MGFVESGSVRVDYVWRNGSVISMDARVGCYGVFAFDYKDGFRIMFRSEGCRRKCLDEIEGACGDLSRQMGEELYDVFSRSVELVSIDSAGREE